MKAKVERFFPSNKPSSLSDIDRLYLCNGWPMVAAFKVLFMRRLSLPKRPIFNLHVVCQFGNQPVCSAAVDRHTLNVFDISLLHPFRLT